MTTAFETLEVVTAAKAPALEDYFGMSEGELYERVEAARRTLGARLVILGHHYQRDEVMRWADARGDSYRLSVLAQQRPEAEYIVFCGVHFM
ncbi:MAG TPA: quinolinate synthase NadA, partial [Pyrinomonadaceae bacterium]